MNMKKSSWMELDGVRRALALRQQSHAERLKLGAACAEATIKIRS